MKQSFEQWKKEVNEQILKQTHQILDADGLPDWDYWDGYESGMTPSAAARAVIKNAMES